MRLRDEFDSLQRAIDYRFRDRGLLEHAMTHTSRANEDVSGGVLDNESMEFLGDAILIAHNAEFDLAFLNAELDKAGRPALDGSRVIDTLMLARRKHPLGPNSLDGLMSRYAIDSSRRVLHGVLLDAELLDEVYIELIGGRQTSLMFGKIEEAVPTMAAAPRLAPIAIRPRVIG